MYSARTYPACACGEDEKKIVNSEERKDRKCLGDVRSVVLAKGEQGGSKKKGKNFPFFLLSLSLLLWGVGK